MINQVPTPVVTLKRSVSISVDGGKSLSACLRAWPKPEFRQARREREAQRGPAVVLTQARPGEWFDPAHHKFLSDELFLLVLFCLAAQKEKNIMALFQLNNLFAYITTETTTITTEPYNIYKPQGCHLRE